MPQKTRISDKEPEPMKQRLMRAAETVFHDKGYQGARVSDIVGLAGAAQGSFYLHFKSKKAILVELIDGFFAHLMDETLGTHPVTDLRNREDMADHLRIIWTTLIAFCRARPELTRLVLDAPSSLPPEDRQHLARHFDDIARALAAYCRHTIDMGLVKPLNPDLMGWVILGMVERALHYAVFVAPGQDLANLARDLTEFELAGLLATGPTGKGTR